MILCHLTRKFSNEKVSNYHSFSGWSSRELGIAGSSHLRDQKSRTCVLVLGLKMSVLRTINLYFFYPFFQAASRDREQTEIFRLGVQKCKKIIYDCVPPKQEIFEGSVMRVRSDTFGDPIFQKGLQNQPSSRIISILGCFAQLCQEIWTFKVNFLCQKSSESFCFYFIEE